MIFNCPWCTTKITIAQSADDCPSCNKPICVIQDLSEDEPWYGCVKDIKRLRGVDAIIALLEPYLRTDARVTIEGNVSCLCACRCGKRVEVEAYKYFEWVTGNQDFAPMADH